MPHLDAPLRRPYPTGKRASARNSPSVALVRPILVPHRALLGENAQDRRGNSKRGSGPSLTWALLGRSARGGRLRGRPLEVLKEGDQFVRACLGAPAPGEKPR